MPIFETLLEQLPLGVAYLDAKLRFVHINARLAAMNGLPAAGHIGKSVLEIMPMLAASAEGIARRILETGQPEEVEMVGETLEQPGVERCWRGNWHPVRDDSDAIVGFSVLVTEISRQTNAEREVQLLNRQLEERANELQTLLDLVPMAIYLAHDPECRRITGNRAAAELLITPTGTNLSQTAPLGEGPTPHRVFHQGRELAPADLPIQQAARGVKIEGEEYEVVFENGARKHIFGFASPLYSVEGNLRGSIAAFLDITERKRAELALRESEARLQLATEGSGVGTWDIDLISGSGFWSPQGAALLGAGRLQFSAQDWTEALHPADRAAAAEAWRKAVEESAPYEVQFRGTAPGPDGIECWVLSRGRIERDASGKPVRGAGVMVDITARKQAEAALREADRRKDEFLATLAHELRNPLAPIRNSLYLLRRKDTLSGESAILDMMDRQVSHVVRLVDDLLEVSRITRGKIELRKEQVDLAASVKSALEAIDLFIKSAHRELMVRLPGEPVLVEADAVRLNQVVSNLLNNALKYTEHGGKIWLEVRLEDDHVVLSVRDNGVGIPSDMLPRVFEMFTQVDRTLGRSEGGLGIGLALVKSLVEMHGGNVEARSAGVGKGSEFLVRLPLSSANAGARIAPHADQRAEGTLLGLSIAVVDDNRDAADSLAMLLRMQGADVQISYDGATALSSLANSPAEVILLDLGMPGMDGFQVAAEVRARSPAHKATLIALTGWGQEEDQRRVRAAGFDAHLVKPVDPAALIALLESLKRSSPGLAPKSSLHSRSPDS